MSGFTDHEDESFSNPDSSISGLDPIQESTDPQLRNKISTDRTTDSHIRLVRQWLMDSKNESRPIENIMPVTLNELLSEYFVKVTKRDGSFYQPISLDAIKGSLERHLKEKGYHASICTDRVFDKTREALKARKNELRNLGFGRKFNAAERSETDDERKLVEAGHLGDKTPKTLQFSLYYHFIKGFGLRGRQEHRDLKFGDVLLMKEAGKECLELCQFDGNTAGKSGNANQMTAPKIFAHGSSDVDPVALYKKFVSKRPQKSLNPNSPFYLTCIPESRLSASSDTWYYETPMGKNMFSALWKKACKEAGVQLTNKVNQYPQKTTASKFSHAGSGCPPHKIMKVADQNTEYQNNELSLREHGKTDKLINKSSRSNPFTETVTPLGDCLSTHDAKNRNSPTICGSTPDSSHTIGIETTSANSPTVVGDQQHHFQQLEVHSLGRTFQAKTRTNCDQQKACSDCPGRHEENSRILASFSGHVDQQVYNVQDPNSPSSSGTNLVQEFIDSQLQNKKSTNLATGVDSIQEFIDLQLQSKKSTNLATECHLRVVRQWLKKNKNETRPLEDILPETLNQLLSEYFVKVTKLDGSPYEPVSLYAMRASLERHLKKKGYPASIKTHWIFNQTRDALKARTFQLKNLGLGQRNHASKTFEIVDERRLTEAGQLGDKTPKALQFSLFYNFSRAFGLRGRQEHRDLKFGDVVLLETEEGEEYLELCKQDRKKARSSKESQMTAPKIFAQRSSDIDPIALYKKFVSKRPKETLYSSAPFYLTCIPEAYLTTSSEIWYFEKPMGKNMLGTLLKNACKVAGIQEIKTNHSLHKTMLPEMSYAGCPPHKIMKVAKQKSTQHHSYQLNQHEHVKTDELLNKSRESYSVATMATASFVTLESSTSHDTENGNSPITWESAPDSSPIIEIEIAESPTFIEEIEALSAKSPSIEEVETSTKSSTIIKEVKTSSKSSTITKEVETSAKSPTIKKEVETSANSLTIKKEVETSAKSPTIKKEVETSAKSPTIKKEVEISAKSSTITNKVETSAKSPTIKQEIETSAKLPTITEDQQY